MEILLTKGLTHCEVEGEADVPIHNYLREIFWFLSIINNLCVNLQQNSDKV